MSNLPVKSNGNLPAKIKSSIKKSAKILGYSASVLALAGITALAPVLALPFDVLGTYLYFPHKLDIPMFLVDL